MKKVRAEGARRLDRRPKGSDAVKHASVYTSPRRDGTRCLIVVRRDEPELCEHLRRLTEDVRVKVFLDRRRTPLPRAQTLEWDRRQTGGAEYDLASRHYIIVPPSRGFPAG